MSGSPSPAVKFKTTITFFLTSAVSVLQKTQVPGTLDDAAACEGTDLEEWQKELYKQVIKENDESLTTLGKDCPAPKSNVQPREADFEEREMPAGCGGAAIRARVWGHPKSVGNTELCGSFSGGSQEPTCPVSPEGVAAESRRDSAADQGNPMGSRGREQLSQGRRTG